MFEETARNMMEYTKTNKQQLLNAEKSLENVNARLSAIDAET